MKDISAVTSYDDRMSLRTEHAGIVEIRIDVVCNAFASKGVILKGLTKQPSETTTA